MPRKPNAQKQAEYRARKKAQSVQTSSASTSVNAGPDGEITGPAGAGTPEEDVLTIQVAVPTPGPASKPSLKDRILGAGGANKARIAPAKKPVARGGKPKRDNGMISRVLPAMAAGFIATFARERLPEEYKPCAPTREEASAILGPLFEELAQHVEVYGQASETVTRVLSSVLAAIGYGARAYITYVRIKHEKAELHHASHPGQQPTGSYQGTDGRSTGPVSSSIAARPNGPDGTNSDASVDGAASLHDDTASGSAEAAIIADMFRRDRAGREQLGLLKRAI